MLGLLIALAIGGYLYMKQTQAVSPGGVEGSTANPRATVDVAGVRNDLVAIAEAERRHFALDGNYVSIDDLRSNGDISLPQNGRGPWSYSSETTGSGFRILATYGGEPVAGVPRSMSIDESMQVSSQ